MATNKHATLRYHTLDRCFSNHGRRFFIEDLVNACNEAIHDFTGISDGVRKRQVFDDITFMESEHGWSIPLERLKEGKRVFYRYSDRSFSIKNQGINQAEAEQLKETLMVLSRFSGLPQFEWIQEIQIRLEDTFKLQGNMETTVGFEQNLFLKGLNYFTELFNAIQNRKVLKLQYQGYKQANAIDIVIHPWYLKQYNNRWFLFGFNREFSNLSNLAIDRILSFKETKDKYFQNLEINFEEYFEDVVGVTVRSDTPVEKVLIKVTKEMWPYILSKPLHGSQKIKNKNEKFGIIELNLQINYEFMALIFSYMDTVEVMEPKNLREKFKRITSALNKKYI